MVATIIQDFADSRKIELLNFAWQVKHDSHEQCTAINVGLAIFNTEITALVEPDGSGRRSRSRNSKTLSSGKATLRKNERIKWDLLLKSKLVKDLSQRKDYLIEILLIKNCK